MLSVSILTIGDEISIGQIVNTNAAWLAERITKTGAKVIIHETVGDSKELIIDELNHLFTYSDIVITSGGLGPTHDDITKLVLCEYFNTEMQFDQSTFENVKELFAKSGRTVTERNREQALIPEKSIPLQNKIGTAPGLKFEFENKVLYSLPGVPAEMKYICENHIVPDILNNIKSKNESVVLYKVLQTYGVFESVLADLIGDTKEFLGNSSLAFLPSYKGVRLRIGTEAESFDTAKIEIDRLEKYIRSKCEKYIFATGEESLSSVCGKILREKNRTISVAESCTGGMLGSAFTEIPGSSDYFLGGIMVYSNASKINILGVNKETILNYGAVSEETAIIMAQKVRNLFHSDYGISITGIAGPDGGSEEKPVGTVFIGISSAERTFVKKFQFNSTRQVNRERSVGLALSLLLQELKGQFLA